MFNVLFFGPYPTPYTGQSTSFKQVFDNYDGNKILFDTTKFKSHKLLNSIYCLFFLPIVFFTYRFDKVYFTCTRSNLGFIKDLQLIFLTKIFKKKIINHLHGADLKSFYESSGFLKKIIYLSYNQIDMNIVLLPAMKNQFSYFKESEIKVVENCYSSEFDHFNIDLEKKKLQVMYLSNLIYSKGIFVFLEAIEEILKLRKEVIVKIAGAPMGDSNLTTKEVYKIFSQKSNYLKQQYPERYFYLGVVKGSQKRDLLIENSIFILPTFYKTEAFPLTIIEAMYFGNVIIANDHNYLSDIINEDNGTLIKAASVNEIIDSTLRFLDDDDHRKKIMISNNIEATEKYNPKIFNEKINKIIGEA